LNRLVKETTEKMDAYQFDETFKAIRGFAWDVLADNYIELAKSRLYGEDGEGKQAAQYTLFVPLKPYQSSLRRSFRISPRRYIHILRRKVFISSHGHRLMNPY